MSIVLILFWVMCTLLTGDILLGKIGVMTGGTVRQLFGDVTHFLLLAAAAALLTAEALRRESARNAKSKNNNPLINAENKKN